MFNWYVLRCCVEDEEIVGWLMSCMKEWIMCGLFDKDMFMRRIVDWKRIVKSGLNTGVLRVWEIGEGRRIVEL